MQTFTYPIKVLFQHCDPAGIVFYPRYFEMTNQTVEAWFDDAIGYSFGTMQLHDHTGVPTVTITADFTATSRIGDVLDFSLHLTKLGRSSADVVIEARCGDQLRVKARKTLVFVNKSDGRPTSWPEAVRPKMARFVIQGA